jgi:outer membrane biosynthesis protein TonB
MGRRVIIFLLVLLIAASAASAQDSDTSQHARPVVRRVAPVYPDLARRMQISGIVKLRATIAPKGSVKIDPALGRKPVVD